MDLSIDYSQYEGRKIMIYNGEDDDIIGIVAGCDPDIGITFAKKATGEPLVCISFKTKHEDPVSWEKEFDMMINHIENGRYGYDTFDICIENDDLINYCAFGQ